MKLSNCPQNEVYKENQKKRVSNAFEYMVQNNVLVNNIRKIEKTN